MLRAALAPAPITLCLCFSLGLVEAAAAALLVGALPPTAEPSAQLPAVPCIPASDLPAADILAFAQGLQNNSVELSSAQLSCLARLLAAKNLTKDFEGLPPDLLLFFDAAEVRGETCKEFYSRASQGHLDLLPRGSARRSGLLRRALTCLGVSSSRLDPEQLRSLGALVCDMEPETIAGSAPAVLESLKRCSALTEAQGEALRALLRAGGTEYGDPSSWDLQALQRLGPLLLALDQRTLSLVPREAREALGRSILASYGSQGRAQRQSSLRLLRALQAAAAPPHRRRRRNTEGCPSVPITSSTVSDPLFINYKDSEEFELCLTDQVLEADLAQLMQQPLPTPFLLAVKRRLQQVYPRGIPEGQLEVLGELSRLYSPEEISQWQLASSDTLLALLDPSYGPWEAPQLQQLLGRYLALGGSWSGALLRALGGESLCQLREEQVEQIPPRALSTAGQLNVSSCSQALKEQLYSRAREAFAGHTNTTRAYYCLLRPYLGGAPAEDLKALAEAGTAIDMDVDTFLALNPAELEKLSVVDVKNLLGSNLQALQEAENETVVRGWVKKQLQRELDEVLGIGLQGGILEPPPEGTTTTPHPSPTATVAPKPTGTTGTTGTTLPTTALSSHPTAVPSTAPTQAPTAPNSTAPNSTAPHPYTLVPSASVGPTATSSPAPTTPFSAPTTTPSPAPTTTPSPAPTTPSPAPTTPSPAPTTTPSPAPTTPSPAPTTTPSPAPTTTPPPCSSSPPHHSTTSAPGTLLNTTANPNTTSASAAPPAALTQEPTSSTPPNPAGANHTTSTPPVPTSPPAPGGTTPPAPATQNTTTPSTHNVPGTLAPNSTTAAAATTATEPSAPPGVPTPAPSPTQSSSGCSTATTEQCQTGAPPTALGPSSTTTTTKEPTPEVPEVPEVPEPPIPTPNGYINLKPQPGSGSMLSSCLLPILTIALGSSLLPVLL